MPVGVSSQFTSLYTSFQNVICLWWKFALYSGFAWKILLHLAYVFTESSTSSDKCFCICNMLLSWFTCHNAHFSILIYNTWYSKFWSAICCVYCAIFDQIAFWASEFSIARCSFTGISLALARSLVYLRSFLLPSSLLSQNPLEQWVLASTKLFEVHVVSFVFCLHQN